MWDRFTSIIQENVRSLAALVVVFALIFFGIEIWAYVMDALADAGLPIGVAAIGGVIAVAIGIFVLEWLKRARKKDDE